MVGVLDLPKTETCSVRSPLCICTWNFGLSCCVETKCTTCAQCAQCDGCKTKGNFHRAASFPTPRAKLPESRRWWRPPPAITISLVQQGNELLSIWAFKNWPAHRHNCPFNSIILVSKNCSHTPDVWIIQNPNTCKWHDSQQIMPSEVPWEQRIVHESALSRSKQVEVDWKSMRMFACDCYLMGVRTNAPFMCSVLWLAVVGLLVASQQNGPGGTLTEVKLKNCQIPKVQGINGITIKSCIL